MMRKSRALAEEAARLADEVLLSKRLRDVGIRRAVHVHENRSVLVNLTDRGVLRIHRGYAYGPDRVLYAVRTFVSSGARRDERQAAERVLIEFPVDEYVHSRRARPPRHRRPSARDRKLVAELATRHEDLNRQHFAGKLSPITFRISDRMRIRLGELSMDTLGGKAVEIAISRFHVERDGWDEVERTLLHEMVHQWQAERGLDIDHGPEFRQRAAEVGIEPRANRVVNVTQCSVWES